jgi:predicted AlkP superfamily phosphohydrolase/phosphomutase
MKKSNGKKLIIIGLDGATFDVLDPYIQKGILPNMERLIYQGVKGKLESTIPPVTGPSWVSFMTGVGPGKHGIYDFVRPKSGSVKRRAVNYQDIRALTLWDYLNKAGKKVGVVNLPITYPPPKINGFIIPGLLAPNAEGEFAHPHGLMAELRKATGEYVFDVWWQRYGEPGVERFLGELIYCTEQRIKTISYLLEKKPWDIFMGVFIGIDRIQHYLWQYIHPVEKKQLSSREQRIVAQVVEYYKKLDNFFGNLIEWFKGEADLFVISDHGFGPLHNKMYINRWLEENGYLSVYRTRLRMVSIKRSIFYLIRSIVRILDPLKLRKKVGIKLKHIERMSAYDFLDCIDWTKTIAYSASNTEQGIYLNVQGREPQGIVNNNREYEMLRDEIIQRLKELKDPETGEKVVTQIFKREELYQGAYVEEAPDIILFLKDGEWLIDVQLKDILYEKASWYTGFGTHRLDGIFIAYGSNIRKGVEITEAHIVDIAPTILYHQQLPVPQEMDGRPLLQIFNEGFIKEHQVLYQHDERYSLKTKTSQVLSAFELEEVEEKLKGLGYL